MAARQNILVRFGARARELRLSKGYSQESFAAKCNLDRTYMGGFERGERILALRNIECIAKALYVTELLAGL